MKSKLLLLAGTALLLSACGKNAHVTGEDTAAANTGTEQQNSGLQGLSQMPANWTSGNLPIQQGPQQVQGQVPQQQVQVGCSTCVQPLFVPSYAPLVRTTHARESERQGEIQEITVNTLAQKRTDPAPLNENKMDVEPETIPPEEKREEVIVQEVQEEVQVVEEEVQVTPTCGEEQREVVATIRGLEASEYDAKTELPYVLGSKTLKSGQIVDITVTSLGEVDGKNVVNKDGHLATKDNHVVFGAELSLPPMQAIVRVDAIRYSMGLTKFENKSEFGSELFCSMDLRRCSGRLVDDPARWSGRTNASFFENDREPVNDVLGKIVREDRMELVSKSSFKMKALTGKLRSAASNDFSVEELFAISDLKAYVEGARDLGGGKRLLRLLTADDIYPVDPKLSISLTVDTCKIPK